MPNHSAFVLGRLISNNIIVGFEYIHSIYNRRKGKKGDVVLKLDMSKAYDKVEWDFFRWILTKRGFDDKWANLIMRCITSSSFTFNINGEVKGRVVEHSLRQGCLFSRYLFLLCA